MANAGPKRSLVMLSPSPSEIFEREFAALKACSDENVSKHVMGMLEAFPFSPWQAQEEYSKKVNDLAWQLAAKKPLLYCYARLMRGFFLFYCENYEEALPLLTETQALFEEHHDRIGAA